MALTKKLKGQSEPNKNGRVHASNSLRNLWSALFSSALERSRSPHDTLSMSCTDGAVKRYDRDSSQRFRVQEIARVALKVDQAIAAHCQGRMTALLSLDRLGEGLSPFERDTLRHPRRTKPPHT
jgi:hypothetical protein